jgi:ABC-2 type transport system permease protein
VSALRRGIRAAALQVRLSAAASMAYRTDFLVEGAMALAWLGLTLLPWLVLFDTRPTVAGWDRPSALLVIAYFTALRAIMEGLISPSLVDLVERIRSGAFDYVLLKPADAQLLTSTARCEPWKIIELIAALGLAGYALWQRGEVPAPAHIALGAGMFGVGLLAMYSLWVLCAAAAFWVVRLDNLIYLLGSIFDVARWPVHVFRGAWRAVLTFVIPVAIMTTFPAMALLGQLSASAALGSLGGALALAAVSRLVWRRAIRGYTSASS